MTSAAATGKLQALLEEMSGLKSLDGLPSLTERAAGLLRQHNEASYPDAETISRGLSLEGELDRLSKHLIRRALKLSRGNKTRAARLLCLDRGTLRYNMKRLGIEN